MDVEDYPGAISEAYRVIAPGGELLMSITHPCFMPPVSRWIKDQADKPLFFSVDRYFDRSDWEERITERFTHPVLRRHRPLEDYMSGALQTGFTLRWFHEPTASDDDLKLSHRFWKLKCIPYFLFMRWQKSSSQQTR